jgi:protein-S-isoprenylcysteine O-methyltransferase Ste14
MSPEELLLRRVVVSASGLLYWGGVLVQARRVRRHIGHSPNLKPRGTKEKLLWLGWFLVIVVWIGQPFVAGESASYWVFRFIAPLLHPLGLGFGLLLVALGYAGTLWCYVAMGDTWRIGINRKEKTTLVNCGPYRWVRHPIYSLQLVVLTGAALLVPTPLSLGILVFHYVCARLKAADEEKYLLTVHDEAYRDLRKTTGRLLPKFWR